MCRFAAQSDNATTTGFNDANRVSASDAATLVNFFKVQGFFVVGGVPYYFRTLNIDSLPDFESVYASLDGIQPVRLLLPCPAGLTASRSGPADVTTTARRSARSPRA